jgi:hypothetical protein
MLILSTLPHYLAVNSKNIVYSSIVIASSTLSVLWHWHGEPKGVVQNLDYLAAFAWGIAELVYAPRGQLKLVFVANSIVLCANLCIKYDNNYWFYHSAWHLLSAMKAIYISRRFLAGFLEGFLAGFLEKSLPKTQTYNIC